MIRESVFHFKNVILNFYKYMHRLGVKATQLFDVLGVDEDFAVDGLELVGAQSEHPRDDVRSLLRRRKLVAVLVALD